jgi:hypothetical protein
MLVTYDDYLSLIREEQTFKEVNRNVQLTMSDERDPEWALLDLRSGQAWVQAEGRGGWRRRNYGDPVISIERGDT